jgi:hypothetical protein
MSNVVNIAPKGHDISSLLRIIDGLRDDIEAGKVVAFSAVGIALDDRTFRYTASVHGIGITNLKMHGAISTLMHGYHVDCDNDDG